MIAISVLAVLIAISAAVIDVRERRIPNKLTYPAAILGFLLQAVLFGWKGLLSGVLGAVVFGGVFLLFHIVHAMGAGDVKLATALGCVVGSSASVKLMFTTAVAGGILAVIYMVRARRVIKTLCNTFAVFAFHAQRGLQTHPYVNLDNPDSIRMPYGLAFAAGAFIWSIPVFWWR